MDITTALMLLSAAIILLLGCAHLVYTFRGPKLLPRDPGVIESMKRTTLVITNETTLWKAWIGFNASHSMAAMLFGLIYGYLAVVRPDVLFGSVFLLAVGLVMLCGLFVLGWWYWFSVPFTGITVALVCYVASVVLAKV